jgi:hypothetical protein
MENRAPLSQARVLYEELRENENTGLLDTWPAPHEADQPFSAAGDAPAAAVDAIPRSDEILEPMPELATRRSTATGHGGLDRTGSDRTRDPDSVVPVNPVTIDKVEQLHAVDGNAEGDSNQSRSSLAAIIRLQSTEIEHLALENDRLAARLEAADRLHKNEQIQRRDLEQQLREASARDEAPAPAFDVDEIRRAAREGMSAEIKPVLMAILDLLESTLPRGAEPAKPTDPVLLSGPASLVAEVTDDFQRLPEILTRPLEELTSGSGNNGSAPDRLPALPAQVPPHDTRMRRPEPSHHEAPRHEAQASAMPDVFAWTNLFS